jgi:hypothetical protein
MLVASEVKMGQSNGEFTVKDLRKWCAVLWVVVHVKHSLVRVAINTRWAWGMGNSLQKIYENYVLCCGWLSTWSTAWCVLQSTHNEHGEWGIHCERFTKMMCCVVGGCPREAQPGACCNQHNEHGEWGIHCERFMKMMCCVVGGCPREARPGACCDERTMSVWSHASQEYSHPNDSPLPCWPGISRLPPVVWYVAP